jgi:NAD(P)-dependent dehydrogenase (short-subunit alcohol dehydrogenase family)
MPTKVEKLNTAGDIPEVPRWGMSDEELAAHPMVFRDDLLAGKVALISGGGSGLGRAMAFLFARLGAQLMLCGRTEDKLASTAQSIKRLLRRDVAYRAMTIRDPEQVSALVEETWQHHGRLDVLVNNAGGQYPQAAIDFTVKGWNAVIDTNLNGTWYMMQAAARQWRDRRKPGCIVNIVANVHRGMPTVAHTCAARAGVIYLSKTVATEWAPYEIRVNCVSPGAVETEGFKVYDPKVVERFSNSNPMRRVGDAWDIAEAVVYMAAPSAKFITGEVLAVDGGQQQWGEFWSGGMPDHFKVDYD